MSVGKNASVCTGRGKTFFFINESSRGIFSLRKISKIESENVYKESESESTWL